MILAFPVLDVVAKFRRVIEYRRGCVNFAILDQYLNREAGVLAKPAVSTWTLISIYLAISVVVVRS